MQKVLSKYFIVRISWVFGSHGNNFVSTMLNLGRDRSNLSVVSDQIGSPTYTYDLVQLLLRMLDSDYYGIYHATNEGYCSWFDFASEIFRITDNQIDIKPIKSDNYKTRAKRPLNSRLSKREIQAVFDFTLPLWEDALKRYITNQYLNV